MKINLRWAAVTAINLVFLVATVQLDHTLSGIPLFIYACGVPVTFAALRLDFWQGFAATVFTGFFFDAGLPIYFGTSAILFGICYVGIHLLRSRFHREEQAVQILVCLVANLALFAAMTLLASAQTGGLSGGAKGLVIDLFLSQVYCTLVLGWFSALQLGILAVFGINLDEEQRDAG